MTNPITTHNTTTTTTTTQKPSTMDNIKDKATNLLDKVTGKSHTYTDHQGVVQQPDNALGHNNTTGLNQPGVNTTGPSGVTDLDNTAGLNNPTNPNVLPAGASTATTTNPAHHGIVHNNAHQQHTSGLNHSGPTHTGAAMAGAAVPHDPSVDRAAYQQQNNPNVAPVQHAVPAGPTGTSNIPTYAQNIPPTAAGVVPSTQVAEVHAGRDTKPSLFGGHKMDHRDHGLGAHQQVHSTAAGGNVPMHTTTNPSTMHSNAGVPNTVPAMGAPGTTTAAGTHVPGEYNPNVAQPGVAQPGVAQGNVAYDPYHRPVA
ncbi:hypothetical protein EMPS_05961 [Entomortierella parvispora]|uniref:Uncharacterized protein n=1 Tax=Entomortierella parvispora TaxID=205924 RepID=A0A9P3HBV2_9FUNG|nr:hypothetical protein EMPS_05961 [Entomortierella parvispora]